MWWPVPSGAADQIALDTLTTRERANAMHWSGEVLTIAQRCGDLYWALAPVHCECRWDGSLRKWHLTRLTASTRHCESVTRNSTKLID